MAAGSATTFRTVLDRERGVRPGSQSTPVLEVWPASRAAASATGTFLLLVLVGGLTKAVGFLREVVLAAYFGASPAMDGFIVAQTIPAAMQRFADELLGATALPLFTGWLVMLGEPVAWARMARLLRWLLLLCCALVAVAMLASRPLVAVLAPGLDPARAGVAVRALEIMLPGIVFVVMGAVCAALLNYYHRFVRVAAIVLLSNALGLACILLYAHRLGVYSAALGMTLSVLGVALLQWWALPAMPRGGADLTGPRVWLSEFAQLAGALGAGMALFNLIPLVERFLSSWLPAGQIALLNYAFKVDWLAFMILIFPLTNMTFPRLATAGAAGQTARFERVLALAFKGALLVLLPVMVFLGVSGDAVVCLLYQRGRFTPVDAAVTAAILKVYILGLPGSAATLVLFYALYALKQPTGRLVAGALGIAVAFGCGWVAVRWWGARGIALTHALNFTALAVLLGWYLRRALGARWLVGFSRFAAGVLAAAAASGALTWTAAVVARRTWAGNSLMAQAVELGAGGSVAVSTFVGFCWLLRVEEVRTLGQMLHQRSCWGLSGGEREALCRRSATHP